MLAKLFNRKAPETTVQNLAESAAADSISTLEKATQLAERLEKARAAENGFSPRARLLAQKGEQVALAVSQHKITADRRRLAEAVARDMAAANKALAEADALCASATTSVKVTESKARAITERLTPLESEQARLTQQQAALEASVQRDFDTAIAQGDATAEAVAAEALFRAKKDSAQGAGMSGPLSLRITALTAELIAAHANVAGAKTDLEKASQARLQAIADVTLIEYDQAAQDLLDAFVAQRIAANAAQVPGSPFPFVGRDVDSFEVQVSSADRILLGTRMIDYNLRKLPGHLVNELVTAAMKAPDLAILAMRVEDVVEPPVELPTREIGDTSPMA